MLIALFLSISPWLVRNYRVFGQFVFIKSNFGNELYLGNREGATGGYNDAELPFHFPVAEKEYLQRSDEVVRNSFLLRKAITFIVADPLSFAQRTMNRFIHYWTFIRPKRGWEAEFSLVAYYAVLTLAVSGLLLSRAKGRDLQLVLLFLLLLPIPYYLTHVRLFRYRFPIEPILMVFAGYTMYWVACHWKNIFVLPLRVFGWQKAF
jgi:hypothetical protein